MDEQRTDKMTAELDQQLLRQVEPLEQVLCWAFVMMEPMLDACITSQEILHSRNPKASTAHTVMLSMVLGGRGAGCPQKAS